MASQCATARATVSLSYGAISLIGSLSVVTAVPNKGCKHVLWHVNDINHQATFHMSVHWTYTHLYTYINVNALPLTSWKSSTFFHCTCIFRSSPQKTTNSHLQMKVIHCECLCCGAIEMLAGGWTNLFEKYARQIGSFPQGSGWKFQKYLKPSHRMTVEDTILFAWGF